MDTPRRWQIASLATAVGGLAAGAMFVDRPTSEPVAPILLEVAHESEAHETFRFPEPRPRPGPEIVTADVVSGSTPVSVASVGTPDGGGSPPDADSGGTTATPSPSPSPSAPSPSVTSVDDVEPSADSPDDVDTAESVDSD